MSEFELVETDEGRGLSRRDLVVTGGLLTAGAALLGAPVAGAATKRATQARLSLAVVTHGDGGSFWSVAKRGVEQAARDLGVSVNYSESVNDPKRQAQLIDTAISRRVKGIAVSAPNPEALKDPLRRAARANIPIVTLNSGANQFRQLGAFTHVGQTERIAGAGAGTRLAAAGAKKLLVVIHEQGNIGLTERFQGARSTFKGSSSSLQVTGTGDISTTLNEIQTKLTADRSIDAVLALNPDIAIAAMDAIARARSRARLATFDLSGDVIDAIQGGDLLFAIDQQQYLQGYLPVVFLYLFNTNLNTTGGGQPVLTGPGFVDKTNAARVAALAKKGTR